MDKQINLLVTINKKYLMPLYVMLDSYAQSNMEVLTNVYVANSELDAEDFLLLSQIESKDRLKIIDVKVHEKWFSDTPVLERLPEESFYRLMAFSYLPKEVEKCIYLDPDIIIRKSLFDLYETDLDGYYIAASSHLHGFMNEVNKVRLELPKDARYINSGVMLMNLNLIRENYTIDSILEVLEDNIEKLYLGDQDLINILFGTKTLFLDEKIYNLDEKTFKKQRKHFSMEMVKEKTAIIHYNGKYKPWLQGYKGELDIFYPNVSDKGPAPHGKIKEQIKAFAEIICSSKRNVVLLISVLLFIAVCTLSYIFLGNELIEFIKEPQTLKDKLSGLGFIDETVFIVLRALQTVVKFLPSEPMEIGAGYAWGTILGMVYCLIGNAIGTVIIFGLIKKYGQKLLEWVLPSKNVKTLNLFGSRLKSYSMYFVMYLITGMPKDGITYIAALSGIKLIPFVVLTTIARIPSVISSTLCGSTLADKKYLISLLIFLATMVLGAIGLLLYKAYFDKTNKVNGDK